MKRDKILIVGPQGSGKTTRSKSILNDANISKVNRIMHPDFLPSVPDYYKGKEAIVIESFVDVKQLSNVAKKVCRVNICVICEYQGNLSEIPKSTRKLFDKVIELKAKKNDNS